MMAVKSVKAYGKFNIALNVLGVENGYHNLDSFVCTVDKYDKINLTSRKDKKILVSFTGPYAFIPEDQSTLNAYKAAEKFMKALQIIAIETHVADARSCCLHPASATHRQMNEEELIAAGVPGDLVRLSCGLENYEDLIADLQQALNTL